MSKLYMMNRMRYAPAAGGPLGAVVKGVGKFLGGIFGSSSAKKAALVAAKLAKNPLVQTAAIVGGGEVAGALMSGGGGAGSRGVSGGWTGRRRKGITATELRGFRKVAKLLHNEGMTIKKKRSH